MDPAEIFFWGEGFDSPDPMGALQTRHDRVVSCSHGIVTIDLNPHRVATIHLLVSGDLRGRFGQGAYLLARGIAEAEAMGARKVCAAFLGNHPGLRGRIGSKLGWDLEGVFRQHVIFAGKPQDVWVYSKILTTGKD